MYSVRQLIDDLKSDFRKHREIFSPAPSDRPAETLRVLLASPGLFVTASYRMRFWLKGRCEATDSRFLKVVLKGLNWLAPIYYAVRLKTDITNWPVIGPGLYLSNRGGITMGPDRLGAGCVIHRDVTIGMDRGGEHPTLGDNVWIGPDTVVYGNKIGSGVVIHGGTVLAKNVPNNCIVEGKPGRIVKRNCDSSNYLRSPDPDYRESGW